jgi:hypothetical protein
MSLACARRGPAAAQRQVSCRCVRKRAFDIGGTGKQLEARSPGGAATLRRARSGLEGSRGSRAITAADRGRRAGVRVSRSTPGLPVFSVDRGYHLRAPLQFGRSTRLALLQSGFAVFDGLTSDPPHFTLQSGNPKRKSSKADQGCAQDLPNWGCGICQHARSGHDLQKGQT